MKNEKKTDLKQFMLVFVHYDFKNEYFKNTTLL